MDEIALNISTLKSQLRKLETAYHQPIKLIAVSKTMSIEKIVATHRAGINAFGENYLLELEDKATKLASLSLEWHFIGTVQSNKSRIIAEYASYLHTLTKISHAHRINNQRPENLPPLKVLIEINISGETNKQGLLSESEIIKLAKEVIQLPRLELCGLMGMASAGDDTELIFQQFKSLSYWLEKLRSHGIELRELSMGMSNDYQLAIAAGSTMVRIGSKIFGKRNYDN